MELAPSPSGSTRSRAPLRWPRSALALALLAGACASTAKVTTSPPPSPSSAASDGPSVASGGPLPGGPVRGKPAVVTSTVDGDTVYVRYGGREIDVRLIGVNTPETVDPSQPVQCYGEQASSFTARMLTGREIRLEFDVERHDRYGRVLAYIWLRGKLFNRRLVADGYATVSTYPPNIKYVDVFETAQRIAQRDRRGLWRACGPGAQSGGGGSGGGGGQPCDRAYPDVCIPSPPPDLDCADISFRNFRVLAPDPQNLDGDRNGIGCET